MRSSPTEHTSTSNLSPHFGSMHDFYTIFNPGPGVPESPPEPRSAPSRVVPIVEDPNAGLTPAEADRLKFFEEARRSGKLFYHDLHLVLKVGGKDHTKEYTTLLQKSSSGQIKQERAVMGQMEERFMQMAFDRAACERIALECWEQIAAIKEERMGAEGH
ncbi:hypothetical protein FA95DRAFT_544110 [Auriscalpium vulgare]|uniref:Uncharacterized protein n=1 Tax=Auriscalpium vulgare TaxID=40419 RepID=A0ACB8RFJ4_9AGAM|nr:hypothetical protein FA95DRAFT_544110 [Auriscalpium vulgare]